MRHLPLRQCWCNACGTCRCGSVGALRKGVPRTVSHAVHWRGRLLCMIQTVPTPISDQLQSLTTTCDHSIATSTTPSYEDLPSVGAAPAAAPATERTGAGQSTSQASYHIRQGHISTAALKAEQAGTHAGTRPVRTPHKQQQDLAPTTRSGHKINAILVMIQQAPQYAAQGAYPRRVTPRGRSGGGSGACSAGHRARGMRRRRRRTSGRSG